MSTSRHLFTSESVSMGHPDKVADAISDAVLDLILDHDSEGRCACETLVTTAQAIVAGEIKFNHNAKKKFDALAAVVQMPGMSGIDLLVAVMEKSGGEGA